MSVHCSSCSITTVSPFDVRIEICNPFGGTTTLYREECFMAALTMAIFCFSSLAAKHSYDPLDCGVKMCWKDTAHDNSECSSKSSVGEKEIPSSVSSSSISPMVSARTVRDEPSLPVIVILVQNNELSGSDSFISRTCRKHSLEVSSVAKRTARI